MWQSSFNVEYFDDKYNPNDIGYLSKNNYISQNFSIHQYITKPFWKILKAVNTFYYERENNYKSGKNSYHLFMLKTDIDWKNYLTVVSHIAIKPTMQRDFYDPRTDGYFINVPKVFQTRTYFSSDYRKTLALDGYIDFIHLDEYNRNKFSFAIMPRIRPNKKLLINYSYENSYSTNEKGFVAKNAAHIYFGKRDVKTISNSLKLNYVFNNKISGNLIARHYWSGGQYSQFYTLKTDGNLSAISDNLNADFNFNAWTLDLIYTWQFAPGSLMTLAWKNVVYAEPEAEKFKYINNFNATFNNVLSNSLSIKVLYYLDAGKLRVKKKI
jgi:hypothetical protein